MEAGGGDLLISQTLRAFVIRLLEEGPGCHEQTSDRAKVCSTFISFLGKVSWLRARHRKHSEEPACAAYLDTRCFIRARVRWR